MPNQFGLRDTEWFIAQATKRHGDKYNYSKTVYVGALNKVTITCKEHGDFEQIPRKHVRKQGCPRCSGMMKLTTLQFIEKAEAIHGDKYDYSKASYEGRKTKVIIICSIHGEYTQLPDNHLMGKGCILCRESHGERAIAGILSTNGIKYIRQHRISRAGKTLAFDFYLPETGVAIEFDGVQHFQPIGRFGGEPAFRKYQENDQLKSDYCLENGIRLVRIPYTERNIESKITPLCS